jgi:plasmid rolling circle replication initiator protein Rep
MKTSLMVSLAHQFIASFFQSKKKNHSKFLKSYIFTYSQIQGCYKMHVHVFLNPREGTLIYLNLSLVSTLCHLISP